MALEWNNPGCPLVRKHYSGNRQVLQKTYTGNGVVWPAINSARDDSPDHMGPAQLARWMVDKGTAHSATLMDEDGKAGQVYSARVTPRMDIVNTQGVLVYAGGIDSIPSAREADIAKATNHVRQGLGELLAGKPVRASTSLPFGCSIKYKNAVA